MSSFPYCIPKRGTLAPSQHIYSLWGCQLDIDSANTWPVLVDGNNLAFSNSSIGYIAQWLERLTADQQVPGSNPGVPFLQLFDLKSN